MFSSLSRRRVVALVVLTCLLLITLDRNGNPVFARVRGVLATLMRPLDAATKAIVLPLERAWYGITNYDDLNRENEALRDQVERLRGADVEARSAILEYQELLAEVQLTSNFDFPTVAAQVVGDSPSNFQNTVEINVGSLKGVQTGMPVTDGAGLIGKITQVFLDRSIVRLINDPEYSVTCQVLSTADQLAEPVGTDTSTSTTTTTTTLPPSNIPPGDPSVITTVAPPDTATTIQDIVRETGTCDGQGGGKPLLLRFTDGTSSVTAIKEGAVVDTAGGNASLAPQGLPIGIITRIVTQSGSPSLVVEVTPNANLRRLNFVTVVFFAPNPDAVGR